MNYKGYISEKYTHVYVWTSLILDLKNTEKYIIRVFNICSLLFLTDKFAVWSLLCLIQVWQYYIGPICKWQIFAKAGY